MELTLFIVQISSLIGHESRLFGSTYHAGRKCLPTPPGPPWEGPAGQPQARPSGRLLPLCEPRPFHGEPLDALAAPRCTGAPRARRQKGSGPNEGARMSPLIACMLHTCETVRSRGRGGAPGAGAADGSPRPHAVSPGPGPLSSCVSS